MATAGTVAPRWVSKAPKMGFVGFFDGLRGVGVGMVCVVGRRSEFTDSQVPPIQRLIAIGGVLVTGRGALVARSMLVLARQGFAVAMRLNAVFLPAMRSLKAVVAPREGVFVVRRQVGAGLRTSRIEPGASPGRTLGVHVVGGVWAVGSRLGAVVAGLIG